MTIDFSWETRVKAQHARQWMDGWQYATVWKFTDVADDPGVLGPPGGDGWEPNFDKGDRGVEWIHPHWATGDRSDVRQYLVYWRRQIPGMKPAHPDAHVHIKLP